MPGVVTCAAAPFPLYNLTHKFQRKAAFPLYNLTHMFRARVSGTSVN